MDFLNNNSISSIAFGFFAVIISGLVTIVVQLLKNKQAMNEAKNAAVKAQQNTTNISNGFATGVNAKLDRVIDSQETLAEDFRHHLQWHAEHPQKKGIL